MGGESRREALVEMERAVAFQVKNETYILKTDTETILFIVFKARIYIYS